MKTFTNMEADKIVVCIISVILALFGIMSNSILMISSMKKSGFFMGCILAIIFLSYPLRKNQDKASHIDWILAFLGLTVGLYTVFTTDRISLEMLEAKQLDYIMAGIAIILVLEAARRSLGIWMAVIPFVFILYALWGHLIPGVLGHFGFTLKRLLLRMYLVDEGVYGITTQVASSYIFLFILFGALLAESGVGDFFTSMSNKIAGASVGGPAKVATISSGLMGTISGSAAANVATTGAFTIPMMKKIGFSPEFAGAVEAVASTGGMIMPPIMGAAAFLMAQYLSLPYSAIMLAAFLPAVLYYISVFAWVHFRAQKLGIKGIKRSEIPAIHNFYRKLTLMFPLVVIIWAMFKGFTPIYAAFLGMITTIVVGFFQHERMTFKKTMFALIDGVNASVSAVMACITAGIIVGIASMTGIGQVVSYNIVNLSGNILFFALFLTGTASLILSMGLPATACYIIVGTVVAPALVRMGASPLSAHMFVFYFSCLSNITPPVAIASFTAAGIAQAKPVKVAWLSMMIAAPGFIIPFLFVYNPVLLLGTDPFSFGTFWAFATACVGVVFMAVAGTGYFFLPLSGVSRLALFLGACLTLVPGWLSDFVGIALMGIVLFLEFTFLKK